MRRPIALVVAAVLTVAACSGGGEPRQQIPGATAAPAPPVTGTPAGTVRAVGGDVAATVVDPVNRVLVVLTGGSERLLLLPLDDLRSEPRTVALPSPASQVVLATDGGSLLVALQGALARVDTRTGTVTATPVDGDVSAVVESPDGTVVAGLTSGDAEFLAPDGSVSATVGGLAGVDALVAAGATVVALDRRQTAVFVLDPDSESVGLALRAGEGATNAVADAYGRVLVTDTTGGELLAYSGDPLILRQRYPVPGGPYAVAFDPVTDLAWVTLTARNEVVGYYVRGGEPQERYRLPTVAQPNSVAVDGETGAVFVGSAAGGGVQEIIVSEVSR